MPVSKGPPPLPPSQAPQESVDYNMQLMTNSLRSSLAEKILRMHVDKFMSNTQIEAAVELVCFVVDLEHRALQSHLARVAPADEALLSPLTTSITSTLSEFLDSSHVITTATKSRKGHVSPIERPLGPPDCPLSDRPDTKGELAVFSITALLTRVLQQRTTRELIMRSSERWKSGDLYQKEADTLSDMTDAKRFRGRREICGPSTNPKELRVCLVGWEDDFTVRCCSLLPLLLASQC